MVGSRGASILKIITSDKNSYPTLIRSQGEEGGNDGGGVGQGGGEDVKLTGDVIVVYGFCVA